jgi:AraC-like DNA-binding protein
VLVTFNTRPSDSPCVDQIWRAEGETAGSFYSIASSYWEVVVTNHRGRKTFTVRGPETRATLLDCPAEGEWIGIRFRLGTYMPHLPVTALVDRAVQLPGAGNRSFYLQGSTWQFPDYENADVFVDRLVRDGLLVQEPIVDAALHGRLGDISARSVQRRFVQTTGLTQRTIRQIERARQAMALLQEGVPILDVVHEAGYSDQPHLTRSLRRWLGQTPAQIAGLSHVAFVQDSAISPD